MAKKRIKVEVEADLHKAIELEAIRQGKTKAEIVRNCAQIFLLKVSDTMPDETKPKPRQETDDKK